MKFMKIGVIIAIIVSLSFEISAQEYKPMLVDGRVWEWSDQKDESNNSRNGIYIDYIKYTVLGDTVINDVHCKNVLRQESKDDPGKIRQYFEEDRKFYSVQTTWYSFKTVCYMDFDINIGECTPFFDLGTSQLTSVDSIMVKGQKYRRLHFEEGLVWVEGIGTNYFMYPPQDLDFHVYDNGVEIFEWNDFTAESFTSVTEVIEPEKCSSEEIFDLQGRRVLKPGKGQIYIINGAKVKY